jgi:hypothetical protein
VISTHAALVVAEDHVQDPVEAVLDGPMCTNDRSNLWIMKNAWWP